MSYRIPTSAVITLGLTLAGLALAVFGPAVYRYPPPATTPSGSESLWAAGVPGQLAVFAVVMIAGSLLVAAGAYLRGASVGGGLPLIWSGAIVLIGGAIATLPGGSTVVTPVSIAANIPDSLGIGVYFVPAALAALIAAIASGASRAQSISPFGQP